MDSFKLRLKKFGTIGTSGYVVVEGLSKLKNLGSGSATYQFLRGSLCYLKRDYEGAVVWYQQSAESGSRYSQYNLGFIYTYGKGDVESDRAEAIKWYELSAADGRKGFSHAQNNLGQLYEFDLDYEKAIELFRLSASQHNPPAETNLGRMYERGWGVERDMREAIRWYKRAAHHGDGDAQFILGTLYETGRGVDQDQKKALDWFRMSAMQGHPLAQTRVRRLLNRNCDENGN